ncbi:MAG: radical SAM protein [Halobacteriovoraceae bacterium]|jgi:radical SAM superfamily enzyme YgiQ (UPF0313 family)|nr:radical SAM protein [Halobacteriovoraceae bacterium]
MFPLKYHEPVFRPPSEANSLLIQVTLGCSNNLCTYCDMYRRKKYSERSFSQISSELELAKEYYRRIGYEPKRIFLCDGDALGASFDLLIQVLHKINDLFPNLDRVGIYATANNMLGKSELELKELASLKLTMVYLGLESGSDKVLHMIVKRNTSEDMIKGASKTMTSGMKLSVIAMLGIGGAKLSQDHITETIRVVNEISPHYFSFLTTMAIKGTPFHTMVERNILQELTSKEMLTEMRDILKGINPTRDILFRANHVSNQFPLGGVLPKDKNSIVATVNQWIATTPAGQFPPKPTSM